MNHNTNTQGAITRVVFDAGSMPENYAPAFNQRAAGRSIEDMRKNPIVTDIKEGQISLTYFDVPEGAAKALGFEDKLNLHVRYIRNKDNPTLSFSLQACGEKNNLKVHIKNMSLKKFAEAKLHGVHPAAFVGSHFEGDSMVCNEMFYLKLAKDIDRHFTEYVDAYIAKLMATQIDPPAPRAPIANEPIFH